MVTLPFVTTIMERFTLGLVIQFILTNDTEWVIKHVVMWALIL